MIDALFATVDWTQIPLFLTVAAVLIARAWQSRELQALRERVQELDEQLFDEVRRHNATIRRNVLLQDEIAELRESWEVEAELGHVEAIDSEN